MVHQAANALAGSTTVLGIISAGTGNDAATGLGVSENLEEACAQALGEPTAIDLIETPAGLGVTHPHAFDRRVLNALARHLAGLGIRLQGIPLRRPSADRRS